MTDAITILVVLFHQEPKESVTLRGILQGQFPFPEGSRVILWDNSPSRAHSIPSDHRMVIDYIHTPENLGLSIVYNRVVSQLSAGETLVILDQDSCLDDRYFESLRIALIENPCQDLFLPQVRSVNSGTLVSPGRLQWIKGRYLNSVQPGIIPSQSILAVASGIAVRARLFFKSDLRFDQRLNLYMIDTKFMMDYARIRPHVFVLDYTLKHGDSTDEHEPIERKLFRFQNRMRAGAIVHGDNLIKRTAYRLYWAWSALKMATLNRDTRFLLTRHRKFSIMRHT